MLNTPLGIDPKTPTIIRDLYGAFLAECVDATTARAIVQMVNATAAGG